MNGNYSTLEFFDFLMKLPNLGLINEATARNLKNSGLLLLSVVELSNNDDVRDLDVEELINKYVKTQTGKPSESTIQNYRSRFKSAVNKFEEYAQVGTIVSVSDVECNLEKLEVAEQKEGKEKLSKSEKIQTFNLPIVVRPETGIMIAIQGLPTDITTEEAERILLILKAYIKK